MKNKIMNDYNIVKSSMNNIKFKLLFFLLIIFSFYAVLTVNNQMGFMNGILAVFTNNWYILFLILTLFLNMFNINQELEKNNLYIIRTLNKKNYYIDLVRKILLSNFIVLLMATMLIIIGLNLKFMGDLKISNYEFYNIPNIWYIAFYIIRLFCILNIIILICFVILKSTNTIYGLCSAVIISSSLQFYNYDYYTVTSIFKIPLFYGYYMTSLEYSNFIFEIAVSILYLLLLIGIFMISFNLLINLEKEIK